MLFEQMQSESQHLEKEIRTLQMELSDFPDGNLLCCRNGTSTKWYLSNGAKPVYLSRKNRPLAETLALKKYKSLQLSTCQKEWKAIQKYLTAHEQITVSPSTLLEDSSCYRELLISKIQPLSDELRQWQSAPHVPNASHPEHLVHQTILGHMVRSKSEVIIANALFSNGIPYHYECKLPFETCTLYPDFTIRHPKTGETLYWEHFGMMENDAYRRQACSKLDLYGSHGIFPDIQLITTYETLEHPLNSRKVQRIIEEYFC